MQAVGGDLRRRREALGELKREENVCQLRLAVCEPVLVGARLPVGVVKADVPKELCRGRNVHDARGPAHMRTFMGLG